MPIKDSRVANIQEECCNCQHITHELLKYLADRLGLDYKDIDAVVAEFEQGVTYEDQG